MPAGPDPDDLTARARIREAALRLFGEEGFERATIRGIAAAAGVSSGLVRHHFGSKQALRAVCDAHLARKVRELDDVVRAGPAPGEVNHVALAQAAVAPYRRYLARALAEGAAERLFDEMVELGERWLEEADERRTDPPEVSRRARAAVGTAMALAVTVLHPHLSRVLGLQVFSPEGDDLLARVLLDLYSHPQLDPEQAAAIRAGLDGAGATGTPLPDVVAPRRREDEHGSGRSPSPRP